MKLVVFDAVGELLPQLLHVPPEQEHLEDLLVLRKVLKEVLERVGGRLVRLQRRYDPPVLRLPPELLVLVEQFLLRIVLLLRGAAKLCMDPHRAVVDLDHL